MHFPFPFSVMYMEQQMAIPDPAWVLIMPRKHRPFGSLPPWRGGRPRICQRSDCFGVKILGELTPAESIRILSAGAYNAGGHLLRAGAESRLGWRRPFPFYGFETRQSTIRLMRGLCFTAT